MSAACLLIIIPCREREKNWRKSIHNKTRTEPTKKCKTTSQPNVELDVAYVQGLKTAENSFTVSALYSFYRVKIPIFSPFVLDYKL